MCNRQGMYGLKRCSMLSYQSSLPGTPSPGAPALTACPSAVCAQPSAQWRLQPLPDSGACSPSCAAHSLVRPPASPCTSVAPERHGHTAGERVIVGSAGCPPCRPLQALPHDVMLRSVNTKVFWLLAAQHWEVGHTRWSVAGLQTRQSLAPCSEGGGRTASMLRLMDVAK